ncbi:MAG TPA: hypothetical protein VGI80_05270 [Pyrinomonadaceae bacterium]|jgi:hypothetical protein
MEILIVGVIIVALMVWTSTRIKRSAAAAFEAETIKADQFTLAKPNGWLSIVDPRKPYLFEAYTKDLGNAPNENIRLGNASVEVSDGTMDEIAELATSDVEITDDIREIVGEKHYRVIELTRTDDEIDRVEWLKFGKADGSVYTFSVKVLADTTAEFRRDIEAMVDSFEIK